MSTGSVIGIDPSVAHPAIAVWPAGSTWITEIPGSGSERLCYLYAAVHDYAALSTPDDLEAIFIERPVGRVPSPEMVRAAGVIEVAILHGLDSQFPHRPSVFRLSPPEWKKAVGLVGNATKVEVAVWAADAVPTRDLTQDEADALAIACAGHGMLSKEGR